MTGYAHRRSRKWVLAIGTPMLIALVYAASVLGLWRWEVSRQLAEAKRSWAAAGGPASIDAIRPEPVPDEQNAAVIYRLAIAHLDSLSDEDRAIISSGEFSHRAFAIVRSMSHAIKLAVRAAEMTHCQWDLSLYSANGPPELPWIGQAAMLCRVLIVSAHMHAHEGRIDEAIAALDAALALSAHIATDPVFLAMIVHLGLDEQILNAIEKIFRDRELPGDASIVERIKRRDYRSELGRVLLADAMLSMRMLDRLGNMPPEALANAPRGYRLFWWWHRDTERAVIFASVARTAPAFSVPWHARSSEQRRDVQGGDSAWFPRSAVAARWITGAIGTSFDGRISEVEIRRAFFLAAVTLRELRDENGEYPRSLQEIMSTPRDETEPHLSQFFAGQRATPIDPVTNLPTRYERRLARDGGGIVLQSDWRGFDGRGEPLQWWWR